MILARKRPEQALQIQVARFLSLALKPPTIWTAIGHGGGGKVRGAILKGMGVQPGWPDILVMHPDGDFAFVIGIELKSATGKLSQEQKDVAQAFNLVGGVYKVAYSLEDVVMHLKAHAIPLHARLS